MSKRAACRRGIQYTHAEAAAPSQIPHVWCPWLKDAATGSFGGWTRRAEEKLEGSWRAEAFQSRLPWRTGVGGPKPTLQSGP